LTVHCGGCGYLAEHHEGPERLCPGLKTKRWQAPPAPTSGDWREILATEAKARRDASDAAKVAYEPPAVLPPLTPARPPRGPHELAAGAGRQALSLGRKAARLGWQVAASYWQAGDGAEGCALRLARGQLRAVVMWSRPTPADSWVADAAYAWRLGASPASVGHTRLGQLLEHPLGEE
jgi:hypothetical protein